MNPSSEKQTRTCAPPIPIYCLPHLVVVADLASSDHNETIESFHLVLTSAKDEYAALEQARDATASGGGYAPLVAFSAENLRYFANLLDSHPLSAGDSFNLTTEMTSAEATAERLTESESKI